MRLLLLFLSLVSFAANAQGIYRIVMFTDEESQAKADQFREYLLTKPPFDKLGAQLNVTILKLDPEVMDCKNSNPSSPRVISCNNEELVKLQNKAGAHLALAFTSRGTGGAGGSIPIASKDYPIQTMFHEMLHAYGFDDEYEYSPSEYIVYCAGVEKSPNVVYFKDLPPYESDAAARITHAKEVPWMGDIASDTLVTVETNLGSPAKIEKNGEAVLGLYRGGACNSADLPGWRPYRNSIMRGYDDDTIYPIYEKVILQNIQSATGVKKLDIPAPPPRCIEHNHDHEKFKGLQKEMQDIVQNI